MYCGLPRASVCLHYYRRAVVDGGVVGRCSLLYTLQDAFEDTGGRSVIVDCDVNEPYLNTSMVLLCCGVFLGVYI